MRVCVATLRPNGRPVKEPAGFMAGSDLGVRRGFAENRRRLSAPVCALRLSWPPWVRCRSSGTERPPHGKAATPGGTVAVTSGGVIATICARALGLPIERWPRLARLLVNASITKVISGQTGTHLVTFNDHAHLESDRALITYR
ncbi:MAG: histidine phosphatase family protein [Streptosporangiaceae bacterium]